MNGKNYIYFVISKAVKPESAQKKVAKFAVNESFSYQTSADNWYGSEMWQLNSIALKFVFVIFFEALRRNQSAGSLIWKLCHVEL